MRYKLLRILLPLCVFVLFAGCTKEASTQPETSPEEVFQENELESYIKWKYNNWQRDRENRESKDIWIDDNNLSSTAENAPNRYDILAGHIVISSYSEYEDLLITFENKRNECIHIIGKYDDPSEIVNTYNHSFDAEFFDDHNLVIVDYCASGSPSLRTRLDKIETKERIVIINIEVESLIASTASCPGNIYFIPVPKNYVEVEISYSEKEWSRE